MDGSGKSGGSDVWTINVTLREKTKLIGMNRSFRVDSLMKKSFLNQGGSNLIERDYIQKYQGSESYC